MNFNSPAISARIAPAPLQCTGPPGLPQAMATFLVVLPGSSLGYLTACLTFVYSTLEIVKTKYKMHIIAAQSLNGRQPDHEQCRMLYAPCFFLRLCLDVCLSANRKKLGGCFPLYSKDLYSKDGSVL
jgi:hypothetical protein